MKSEVESEELERKIKMKCQERSITILIEEMNSIEKYRGVYEYELLPFEFKVLFEDIEQLYRFLAHDMHQVMSVRADMLCIMVQIIGKLKEFQLPLERIALTAEEQLAVQLQSLKTQLNERNQHFEALQLQIREKDNLIEEKQQGIASLNAQLKEKQAEHSKLLNKIRILQSNIEQMNTEKGKIESEQYTPVKKLPNSNKNSRKKQNDELGTKVIFTVDPSSRNIANFKISGEGDVQKISDSICQLNHFEALPKQGKYYFDIKIQSSKSKTNSNMIVGIITEKNKDQAHSCNKLNCICFNGYDSTICEQQKPKNTKIKPKEGDRIRTMVDMTLSQLEWFILGDDGSCLIGKANIPAGMSKQSIYPFFQLNFDGNSIKMNP